MSHLFLTDKRALIWRSQDAGVSPSVVTRLVYRNHSFLLGCLTLSLLFSCWRPRGNPPIGGCRSSSSHIFSVLLPLFVSAHIYISYWLVQSNHSLKPSRLVVARVWKSPDADPFLAVKLIQRYSMMLLCCHWIMPCRSAAATNRPKKGGIWIKDWLKRSF